MVVLQVLVFVAGVAVVLLVLETAIRTVVLPRGARSLLTAVVFRTVGAVVGFVAKRQRRYEGEDRIRALHAPVGLLAIVGSWLVLILMAFTLMFWALRPDAGWGAAFLLSGSSITTLGFAPAASTIEQILAFSEAGLGLLLLTLLITFLPSIYSAFSERETKVGLLEVRAGSPPNAVEFLQRYHRIGWLDQLDTEWIEWEEWFGNIEESHTSYASLPFFRSPDPNRSWITAAGTVLDAAALYASTLQIPTQAPAAVCIRAGFIALRKIAAFFAIPYNPDPVATDAISITREEYDAAYDVLAESGLPVVADRDQGWRDFAGWRVNYDTVLLALAEMVHAPYAPWSNDRSPPDHARRKASWMWSNRRDARSAGP